MTLIINKVLTNFMIYNCIVFFSCACQYEEYWVRMLCHMVLIILNINFKLLFFQADKERAERQREFLAQLEREAAGFDESSEPTSMTNSSTVEGEHTIQGNDEDDDTLAGTSDGTFAGPSDPDAKRTSPDVVETYSSDLRPNEDEIQLLRLKLEEAQCKNRVIEEEMHNLKSKVSYTKSLYTASKKSFHFLLQ